MVGIVKVVWQSLVV